jgi:hypothetical protein
LSAEQTLSSVTGKKNGRQYSASPRAVPYGQIAAQAERVGKHEQGATRGRAREMTTRAVIMVLCMPHSQMCMPLSDPDKRDSLMHFATVADCQDAITALRGDSAGAKAIADHDARCQSMTLESFIAKYGR